MNINFKTNRVKLRKLGNKIMQNFTSVLSLIRQYRFSIFYMERNRRNIFVICLQFCKSMFWQSNFVKSFLSHDRVKTYDCGEKTAGWFSMFLGRPCRLIRQSPDRKNSVQHKNTKGLLSFLKKLWFLN